MRGSPIRSSRRLGSMCAELTFVGEFVRVLRPIQFVSQRVWLHAACPRERARVVASTWPQIWSKVGAAEIMAVLPQ